MPTSVKDCPDITESLLVKLAGIRAYERGADYFDESRVEALIIKDSQVTAEVDGTESYHVTLTYNQRGLSGSCDCPASEGIDFCKHCVATALALKAQIKKPPLKKSTDQKTVLTTWLEQQSKAEIIQHFVAVVTKDRNLRREWFLKAEKGLGRMDKTAIKKQITSAFPVSKHLYEYPKVRAYFASATLVIKEIEQPLQNLAAPERLKLIDYAIQRIEQALETIDDSGGFRYDSLNILTELHQNTLTDIKWNDEDVAAYLLDLSLNDNYSLYGEIPHDYKDSISPASLEHFYDQAQERWDVLPRLTSNKWAAKRPYSKLETFLCDHAREKDDMLALIAIKEKVAIDSHDYLRLAEMHFEREDYQQTQTCLDKAHSSNKYGHHPERDLQIKLWQKTGHGKRAIEDQWCYFQQHHRFDDYKLLLQLAEQENDPTNWTAKAIDFLHEQLETDKTGAIKKTNMHGWSGFTHDNKPNTLTSIYLKQQDLESAWQISLSWPISDNHQLALAQALTDTPTEENWTRGLQLYQSVIDSVINRARNDAYQKAVTLLKPLADKATTPNRKMYFSEVLAALRETHKRKRNFMTLLTEAFPL